MSLDDGEAAAITALRAALNDGIGTDDDALQISTDIIDLLKTWIQGATGVPNTTTNPLLDSLSLPVTGEVDIT